MILVLDEARKLTARLGEDPRLTKSQVTAMLAAAKRDPGAYVSGLDADMRPVVHAKLPGPGRKVAYALLRNGAPAQVKKPMTEAWG